MAMVVTIVWAFQYIGSMILSAISPWVSSEVSLKLLESANVLSSNGEQGNAAFMIVLGFYFLGNKADELISAAVGKFTKGARTPKN